jgi:hypothetical protein
MAGAAAPGGPMPLVPNNPLTAMQQGQRSDNNNRTVLNTYIYEYFLREGLYTCAREMLKSNLSLNVDKSAQREDNGNPLGNGVDDDPMDTDSKDADIKNGRDLPVPNIPPQGGDSCFLYEWFCLFWDMMSAQRQKQPMNSQVSQYVNHQQQQSRMRQSQQQELLRSMRPDGSMSFQNPMVRNMPNGMQMAGKPPNLARTAMANNQNNPQAMQMLQQAKQNQMQRDPSHMDGAQNRPGSPSGAENAPSPSKRPRLDGNAPFNPQQAGMMPNGQRPQGGMPGQQVGNGPNNTAAAQNAHHMLIQHGINPAQLTPAQFQSFQNQPPGAQQKSIQAYSQNLQQHHGSQMPNKQQMPNPNGPPGQGSPMMTAGPDGAALNTFYNANEMTGPGGMRAGPGGAPGAGGSNHALQDYQMQLMLLEQQNKKRLMMARQEQDSIGNVPRGEGGPAGPGGPGQPGPNGQPFPQDTSPQAARTGASPNPAEQMKRGTPQMNAAGVPSPLPEGAQSRGSPNPMGFMPNNMDPNMQQHFFKQMNGMDGNVVAGAQMNGAMRPPSSHPNQAFNGQMTPQMMQAARQQGQGGPGGPGGPQMQQQWQGGPNGNAVPPQGPQGQQMQGTPQQRAMPPPSAPAGGNAANGRTQPSSPAQNTPAPPTPQQANKPAPSKKKGGDPKKTKQNASGKKGNQATAATPVSDTAQDAEPPTPATPITPVNPASFNKSGPNAGAAQPAANAAPASAAPAAPAPVGAPPAQPDAAQQMNSFGMNGNDLEFGAIEFANPLTSNDVLHDFDFDSFLHDEGDQGNFDFNPTNFMDSGPIEAE